MARTTGPAWNSGSRKQLSRPSNQHLHTKKKGQCDKNEGHGNHTQTLPTCPIYMFQLPKLPKPHFVHHHTRPNQCALLILVQIAAFQAQASADEEDHLPDAGSGERIKGPRNHSAIISLRKQLMCTHCRNAPSSKAVSSVPQQQITSEAFETSSVDSVCPICHALSPQHTRLVDGPILMSQSRSTDPEDPPNGLSVPATKTAQPTVFRKSGPATCVRDRLPMLGRAVLLGATSLSSGK